MQFYERSCAWVYETQGNGVEALALQTKDGFLGSIYSVTQDRVAKVLGVSQVQVSRIEKKAVGRLRERLME